MLARRTRWLSLAAFMAGLPACSSGGDPAGTEHEDDRELVTLTITTSTSGPDPDPDGYVLHLDGGAVVCGTCS